MTLVISDPFILHTLTALHNCFIGIVSVWEQLHYSRLLPIEGFDFFQV